MFENKIWQRLTEFEGSVIAKPAIGLQKWQKAAGLFKPSLLSLPALSPARKTIQVPQVCSAFQERLLTCFPFERSETFVPVGCFFAQLACKAFVTGNLRFEKTTETKVSGRSKGKQVTRLSCNVLHTFWT